MGRKPGTRAASKYDPELMAAIRKTARLDEETGNIKFDGMYVSVHLDFGWAGSTVSVPVSHVVWFLTHGRWPNLGTCLDHIDHDPMNNKPSNLAEITHAENQRKRRGRIVSPNYGIGKYGYGMGVTHDKRDGRFYVTRQMSRGHGNGDLKNVKVSLGGYDTLADAETKVRRCIRAIKRKGLSHIPAKDPVNPKKRTVELDAMTQRIRNMRLSGKSYQYIAEKTGFSIAAVYRKANDIKVNLRTNLTDDTVREIRRLYAAGSTGAALAAKYGMKQLGIYKIVSRKTWKHVA